MFSSLNAHNQTKREIGLIGNEKMNQQGVKLLSPPVLKKIWRDKDHDLHSRGGPNAKFRKKTPSIPKVQITVMVHT